MLSKNFINELKNRYCVDDYTQIEGFWEAYNDDLPSIKHCVHHKYGIVLNKTGEQLKYMGLYEHRYARELQIMLRSDHTSLHRKNKKLSKSHKNNIHKSMLGKNKGKNNGMYGREHWNKGISPPEDQRQRQREKMLGREPWNKGLKTGKRPEETKQKISESMKGENNPNFGKPSPIKDKKRYFNEETQKYYYK